MSKIEDAVVAKLQKRAEAGLAKYGTTMERTDLTYLDWLKHAQEEAMDLAVYLERLIQDAEKLQESVTEFMHKHPQRARRSLWDRPEDDQPLP